MATEGHGTTITFGTSSFTAEIRDVNWTGRTRVARETSYNGTTGYRTYIPSSLIEGGEVTFDILYDGDDAVPISGAAETITIDWGGSGNTDAFTGFVTSWDITAPWDDLMTASVTVKVADDVTSS